MSTSSSALAKILPGAVAACRVASSSTPNPNYSRQEALQVIDQRIAVKKTILQRSLKET
jgi:hypothetical protein